MKREDALAELANVAALWSVGYVRAAEVVRVACDVLVAGLEGDGLCMLAGVAYRNADDDVPQVLKAALGELGLDYHAPGSQEAKAAAVRVLAGRVMAGLMAPRDLAFWAHRTIGHDQLPLAERLVELDDVYDCIEYSDQTAAEVDADVVAEARRIIESSRLLP
ncbi:hypothetical protein Q3W71_20430 [Micromonospora sp. C28SCA-DRY-2]|uniref:hypothetical protein n=1 Tax=Micromonospora sp. C28SCA-DRY-2 TaxID=3059522 RepID=UPI00267710C2|nr:hypothetical protein [Micromonospora sp. C28SCA-DRY-2]MDO3704037.1 hypothetical protein [Micromonospora sp. C28SCA-DRY-2]